MIGAAGRVGLLGLQARRPTGRLLLYPRYVQDYLDRVTDADRLAGNALGLELGVTDAFNTTLQAMVGDASLGVSNNVLAQAASLVKASCAMQGARTLPGALVPLAADMPAPTNVGPFVAGDYNRRTGLGDPANVSKYLNSNRADNASTPTNRHVAVHESTPTTFTANVVSLGVNPTTGSGDTLLVNNAAPLTVVRLSTEISATIATAQYSGFFGASRSLSASYTVRINGASTTVTEASSASVSALPVFIFAQNNNGAASSFTNARINFYSLGSALDLAILNARIAALSNAIQAAIAP